MIAPAAGSRVIFLRTVHCSFHQAPASVETSTAVTPQPPEWLRSAVGAFTALSRKVGFRVGPGLRDRVIYRELFPFGLTVADLSPTIRPVAMSLQHVAARQELRALMIALGFNGLDEAERIAAE